MKRIFLIFIGFVIVTFISVYLLSFYFSSQIYTIVDSKIYRSGQLSHHSLENTIRVKGIKTIINLRGEAKNSLWYVKEREIVSKHNVKMYDIRLSPHELPKYQSIIQILDVLFNSEKPLLIHCYKGSDRAGLVSALALALEKDLPLNELRKQFSLRYGVLPFTKSIGPLLFSKYEAWLQKTNKVHNSDNILYWIKSEYQDSYGNLVFMIDQIHDIPWTQFSNKNLIHLKNDKAFFIRGWAFDASLKIPPEHLNLIIDNKMTLNTSFIHNRTDVAKYFDLGDQSYKDFWVGWEVKVPPKGISYGCHTISFQFTKKGVMYDIPSDYNFCI